MTNAVNEEIINLKQQIERLNEKCALLEKENIALRQRNTFVDAVPKAQTQGQSSTPAANTVQMAASQTQQQVLQASSISNLPSIAAAFVGSLTSVPPVQHNEIPTLNDESMSMHSVVSSEQQQELPSANVNTFKETMNHSEEVSNVQTQNDEPQQI